uniref:Uncharacterized protein n=1 Tax=Anguilla anguilla TaxID=7936 RepID=A0A0E9WF41_ANGAN
MRHNALHSIHVEKLLLKRLQNNYKTCFKIFILTVVKSSSELKCK